jgi:putative acetyltransferase
MTITIRRAAPADAAAYARIMGDPAVFPGLMQMPYASEEAWRARLVEGMAPGKTDLLLVAERGGEVVGTAGLHPVGPALRRRHVVAIGISVAREAQGQGVGTALMQAMCDYADGWMGVLRIELTVYADNAAAIALYRKFGFEVEGRHRGYALRDGRYVDVFAMARIHPAPPSIEPQSSSDA